MGSIMWSNISHWWYCLVRGTKNCIKWFPIIWNDRDWDWEYLVRILKKKLEGMERIMREEMRHATSEESACQMMQCIQMLRNMEEDDYSLRVARARGLEIEYGWKILGTEEEVRKVYTDAFELERQELEEFGKVLGKYMKHWWI